MSSPEQLSTRLADTAGTAVNRLVGSVTSLFATGDVIDMKEQLNNDKEHTRRLSNCDSRTTSSWNNHEQNNHHNKILPEKPIQLHNYATDVSSYDSLNQKSKHVSYTIHYPSEIFLL